jgi:hypothetical protein
MGGKRNTKASGRILLITSFLGVHRGALWGICLDYKVSYLWCALSLHVGGISLGRKW